MTWSCVAWVMGDRAGGGMGEHLRSVVWQRLDLPGGEYCALSRVGDGWRLAGVAVAAFGGVPLRADYAVVCDEGWGTREVDLTVVANGEERHLHLQAEGDGSWT